MKIPFAFSKKKNFALGFRRPSDVLAPSSVPNKRSAQSNHGPRIATPRHMATVVAVTRSNPGRTRRPCLLQDDDLWPAAARFIGPTAALSAEPRVRR
jgi:hypothetical protein